MCNKCISIIGSRPVPIPTPMRSFVSKQMSISRNLETLINKTDIYCTHVSCKSPLLSLCESDHHPSVLVRNQLRMQLIYLPKWPTVNLEKLLSHCTSSHKVESRENTENSDKRRFINLNLFSFALIRNIFLASE